MSNTKRALEMLRELHIRGEHERLDQEDIGTVIAALDADASPSASEPLPEGWTHFRDDAWQCEAYVGPEHAESKCVPRVDVYDDGLVNAGYVPASVLRALLGRSEPTRAEVEREIADWLEAAETNGLDPFATYDYLADVIRSGEYRSTAGEGGKSDGE